MSMRLFPLFPVFPKKISKPATQKRAARQIGKPQSCRCPAGSALGVRSRIGRGVPKNFSSAIMSHGASSIDKYLALGNCSAPSSASRSTAKQKAGRDCAWPWTGAKAKASAAADLMFRGSGRGGFNERSAAFEKFILATLAQLPPRLEGKDFVAGSWPRREIDRTLGAGRNRSE